MFRDHNIDKNTSLRRVRHSPEGEDGKQGSIVRFISNGCQLSLACGVAASLRAYAKQSRRIKVRNWMAAPPLAPCNDKKENAAPAAAVAVQTSHASSPEFVQHSPTPSSPEFVKRILRGSIRKKIPAFRLCQNFGGQVAQNDNKKIALSHPSESWDPFRPLLNRCQPALACAKRKGPPSNFRGTK